MTAIVIGLGLALWPTGRAPSVQRALAAGRVALFPLALAAVALCACCLAGGTYSPFLYYRF
jgi:hypothetical protein